MRPHGVMFHHFHDDHHPKGQGSISAQQLADMIEYLGPDRILPAEQWLARGAAGALADDHLCLTFDDSLRCQFDIAYPVLQEYGITAFWFVYTSVLQGELERLELYRQFRITRFDDMDDFYAAFFEAVRGSAYASDVERRLAHFDHADYLADYPFYTPADRRFRYVRDELLGPRRYNEVMDSLIASCQLDLHKLSENLWMDDDCIRRLDTAGQIIGLHSHTHPTRLASLDAVSQRREYRLNHDYLTQLLSKPPVTMSHPCNSYNDDTLRMLREQGMMMGFRANMARPTTSMLEYPRQDHANILAEMLV